MWVYFNVLFKWLHPLQRSVDLALNNLLNIYICYDCDTKVIYFICDNY